MKLDQTYSTDTLPEGSSFDPLPPGWYSVTVSDAELRDTKSGTGQYISLSLTVDGPSHEGRIVWANLNIRNASSKAEEIGRQQFGALLRAIGLKSCSDTDELIAKSLQVKLTIRKDEQYGDKNEVKGFKAREGTQAQQAQAPRAQRATTPAGNKPAPPWAKKPAPADDDELSF